MQYEIYIHMIMLGDCVKRKEMNLIIVDIQKDNS